MNSLSSEYFMVFLTQGSRPFQNLSQRNMARSATNISQDFGYIIWFTFISIGVTKTLSKTNLSKKDCVSRYNSWSQSNIRGSQSRNSRQDPGVIN